MAEKEEKIFYIGTHAGDNPEKAAMPFVMACAALAMDIKATVCLQGDAVYLEKKGYVDNMLPSGGFPHIKELILLKTIQKQHLSLFLVALCLASASFR